MIIDSFDWKDLIATSCTYHWSIHAICPDYFTKDKSLILAALDSKKVL